LWTESGLFNVDVELGLVGFITYLAILGLALQQVGLAWRWSEGRRENWLFVGTTLWFVALLVAQIQAYPYLSWFISVVMWALVAFAVNWNQMREKAVAPGEEPEIWTQAHASNLIFSTDAQRRNR
jgi:hypothetical protein